MPSAFGINRSLVGRWAGVAALACHLTGCGEPVSEYAWVSGTDGLAVTSSPLPGFPGGLLVVQDDENPGGNQNFKLVSWSEVGRTLGL